MTLLHVNAHGVHYSQRLGILCLILQYPYYGWLIYVTQTVMWIHIWYFSFTWCLSHALRARQRSLAPDLRLLCSRYHRNFSVNGVRFQSCPDRLMLSFPRRARIKSTTITAIIRTMTPVYHRLNLNDTY